MAKNQFLLLKIKKNTESAQLCSRKWLTDFLPLKHLSVHGIDDKDTRQKHEDNRRAAVGGSHLLISLTRMIYYRAGHLRYFGIFSVIKY